MKTVTVLLDGMFWVMLRIWLVLSGRENGELLGDVEEVSCKMNSFRELAYSLN